MPDANGQQPAAVGERQPVDEARLSMQARRERPRKSAHKWRRTTRYATNAWRLARTIAKLATCVSDRRESPTFQKRTTPSDAPDATRSECGTVASAEIQRPVPWAAAIVTTGFFLFTSQSDKLLPVKARYQSRVLLLLALGAATVTASAAASHAPSVVAAHKGVVAEPPHDVHGRVVAAEN